MVSDSFQHQTYTGELPSAPYEVIRASFPPQPGSEAYDQFVMNVGPRLTQNVDAVYLIHGTFVGNDILGWVSQMESVFPDRADQIRSISKKLIDSVADDTGNFPESYAQQLSDIGRPFRSDWSAELFHWSGENNHSARCVAAVEILDQLFSRQPAQQRVLLMCHSHAGNVMAIVSNLLAAKKSQRDRFFEIIAPVFRDSDEIGQIQRVIESLDQHDRIPLQLDVVTLGTPIRYQWIVDGCRQLLHFVNHVPQSGAPEYLSPFPKDPRAILQRQGDLIQQLGIAGTNILPYLFDIPLQLTEQKLNRLLQPISWRRLWENLKLGMRVAEQGTTLLVEYDNEGGLAQKLAGHGIYTQREWLPFHIQQIVDRFYSSQPDQEIS